MQHRERFAYGVRHGIRKVCRVLSDAVGAVFALALQPSRTIDILANDISYLARFRINDQGAAASEEKVGAWQDWHISRCGAPVIPPVPDFVLLLHVRVEPYWAPLPQFDDPIGQMLSLRAGASSGPHGVNFQRE